MNFRNQIHIKSLLKFTLLFSLLAIYSCNEDDTQTVITMRQLVWADEFLVNGKPDANSWNFEIGTGQNGWGNNEFQYYTDRLENAEVIDGKLHIRAIKESFQGAAYTSARITTKGHFEQKYGRFEAKIKLPWGQGIWPAFWMLGDDSNGSLIWPQIGEIDIMEFRGQQPTVVHGSIHGPGYSGGEAITKSFTLPNDRFDTGFHIFGIEWGPDYINYYVDNVLYNQITPKNLPAGKEWVFNNSNFYIILNFAVGGSFVGSPNAETVFPQEMIIDYVKVFK